MNDYLIGMYGKFDDSKYERDFRPGFWGVEACLFMAPFTGHIHLWNSTPDWKGVHYPVLPKQKPAEGWADIRKYIDILRGFNNRFKVLFEHRSDLISDEELDECYQWVAEMFKGQQL